MEITKHYTNQGIKQLYVLVLGLDVIGNPFGFVRGVSTGVKDFFYEPYQVSWDFFFSENCKNVNEIM